MAIPQVSHNDAIEVFQWRNGVTFTANVESGIMTDEDVPYVCYNTTNGDEEYHHHAAWDEDNQRWEDGEF